MGLFIGTAKYIYKLIDEFKMGGNLLTLGHQRILVTPKQARDSDEFPLYSYESQDSLEYHSRWQVDFLNARTFFINCGFSLIDELDVSEYEGANVVFDLNSDKPREDLINRYDAIFDGSTLEHIFSTHHSLTNLIRFTKIGGYIIHMSPCNNFPLDGFYQFTPYFFKEFYEVNGFECKLLKGHRMSVTESKNGNGPFVTTDDFFDIHSLQIDNSVLPSLPAFEKHAIQLFVVVQKVREIENIQLPFQSRYSSRDYWIKGLV